MNKLVLIGCVALHAGLAAAQPPRAVAEDPAAYLGETEHLDFSHPEIRGVIAAVAPPGMSPTARAVALHDFVRDEVLFGFEPAFYDMTASEVLRAKRGYCNTKSTLFVALLRGAGVPARHRFYGLSSSVLNGLLNPNSAYVDHSIVEVHLDGQWVKTDSYLVDRDHFANAKRQLNGPMGLGIRRDGSFEWDGVSDSFAQFHPRFSRREFGVYDDIAAFYDAAPAPNNKLGPAGRFFYRRAIGSANARIANLRDGR